MEKEFNMPLEGIQLDQTKEKPIEDQTNSDDTINKAALFSYLMS